MANYRLPMDADGVKYHGTVDQNEENPGQFMYGLDENGNKRIIRTDEQGNVLTRVTGSMPELYTVIDETDIPANGQSSLVDMQLDGREKEVYVWVNTDSDDWKIRTNYLELDAGRLDTALYPRGRGTTAYERYHQPKKFFFVGMNTEFLVEEIGNLEQAIMQATYFQGAKIRFDNQSSESVFATVRILKKY